VAWLTVEEATRGMVEARAVRITDALSSRRPITFKAGQYGGGKPLARIGIMPVIDGQTVGPGAHDHLHISHEQAAYHAYRGGPLQWARRQYSCGRGAVAHALKLRGRRRDERAPWELSAARQ